MAEMPEVVVALDYPSAEAAGELVDRLPVDTWYKVGLELFTAAGPRFVESLAGRGASVFLDLKLHDIPNTVAGAVRSVARLGAGMLTVHASGGAAMIRAAVEAADAAAGEAAGGAGGGLRLLAVTALTSLDDRSLAEVMGQGASVERAVGRLAGLAREAGADGVVASVEECRAVKVACGADFLVATPGIRLAGGETHDQKRVSTPAEAREAGSDYLVVGRTITKAADPVGALRAVREAMR